MAERDMTMNDVLIGERETSHDTLVRLEVFFNYYETIINTLISMMYYCGEPEDANSNEGKVHFLIWTQYMQNILSYRASILLMKRGYYVDSILIVRSILESFIQSRYALRYTNQIDVIAGVKEKRITFKKMFDEFSTGYYEKYYGDQLSGIAHRKFIIDIFRVERDLAKDKARTIFIPEYDEAWAGFIVNHLIVIMLGLYNLFPKVFHRGFNAAPRDISEKYNKDKNRLNEYWITNKKEFPRAKDWHEKMQDIINIKDG